MVDITDNCTYSLKAPGYPYDVYKHISCLWIFKATLGYRIAFYYKEYGNYVDIAIGQGDNPIYTGSIIYKPRATNTIRRQVVFCPVSMMWVTMVTVAKEYTHNLQSVRAEIFQYQPRGKDGFFNRWTQCVFLNSNL